MSRVEKPFESLGKHLRNVREQSKRSIAEVSGAIEIDEHSLNRIEIGQDRPDEDVMLLLISYFNVQDQEALHLWELAQYDSDISDHLRINEIPIDGENGNLTSKSVIMMLAMDVRTMYSDGFEVHWNPAGLTFNFTQSPGPDAPQKAPISIAKVGLSYVQAEAVLQTLQSALLHAKFDPKTKLLPPSENKKK